jgi:hypothetical protein
MTRENPRWDEFCEKLNGPEGCNFTRKNPDDAATTTWKCDNSSNRPFARKILAEMGLTEDEIDQSLSYFDANGGYCDCEILFNVDR